MRLFYVTMLAGCSFVFVPRPPPKAPPTVDCTESRIAPISDTVLTGGLLAGAIAGLSAKSNCPSDATDIMCLGPGLGAAFANTLGAVALLGAVVYGVSALDGFRDTGTCRTLHATVTP
jgi:hypothetical protein